MYRKRINSSFGQSISITANTLFQGVNHAVESEFFSTSKNNSPKAAKSKRPLSANSSLDESTLSSGPKKSRYENFYSFTEDPKLMTIHLTQWNKFQQRISGEPSK
jgi:hypothetical protein